MTVGRERGVRTGAWPLTAGVANTSACLTTLLTGRSRPADTTESSYTNRGPPESTVHHVLSHPVTATATPAGSLDLSVLRRGHRRRQGRPWCGGGGEITSICMIK